MPSKIGHRVRDHREREHPAVLRQGRTDQRDAHMSCAQAKARLIAAMPSPVAKFSGPMNSATDWRTPKLRANTIPAAAMIQRWRRFIMPPSWLACLRGSMAISAARTTIRRPPRPR
jgi:hypothetical protein